MKTYYLLIVTILFSAFAKAQQPQDSVDVEVPRIYVKAYQGESISVENTMVKLVQVLEDSRCPKNVQCVWAGQAKVEVEITDSDGTKTTKEVVLNGRAIPKIHSKEGLEITIQGLSPYPISNNKINGKEYYLRLDIRGI